MVTRDSCSRVCSCYMYFSYICNVLHCNQKCRPHKVTHINKEITWE
ncbi:unnamed protein product [Staurois parvus]|uniref:Uncharacterized protein n=1 Tax=Staurois parvus TaxID=386267 RepID=A0ABN9GFN9_9NEOB|nr:unnamed protein product [Staurois parvus]